MWKVPRNPNFDKAIKDFNLLPIPYLPRWDIVILFIRQYKLKRVAEVGTLLGATAERVLREHTSCIRSGLTFEHYYMIDKVAHKPCIKLAQQYPKISSFIIKSSVEAAKDFEDRSLDMVFLDAFHYYKDVVEDMKAWIPKIKKGGWFLGHDFFIITLDKWHNNVRQAADDVFGYRDYYVFPDMEPWARGCTFIKRLM